MAKKPKKPRMAKPRPEEVEFLKRWKNIKGSNTFFEKMDKDPVYSSTVESRTDADTGSVNMGNSWGVGKHWTPKKDT